MLCKTFSATCIGMSVITVTVESDISAGVGIYIVGLPDNAVKESLMRITTALRVQGFALPGKRIVINLAPADIRKEGSAFDLAIAISLICAMGVVPAEALADCMIMGELALDGGIRNISGALPIADHARLTGFKRCIMPYDSAMESVDIDIEVYGVRNLTDVISILKREDDCSQLIVRRGQTTDFIPSASPDFKDVKGQSHARRGLEIAASGGHNLILIGSPGCGKTLMASCLPSILPRMSKEESIQTSKIYSIAGKSVGRCGLLQERPFRAPHNSASKVSLLGGGQNAQPGEISLAHNGVLYLDEVTQFSKGTLDLLRQPLEDGKIVISRARYKVEYPCSFMFISSMNP
ncbi:MAG: YifB family Mg chelatase-like AAA ATPase, partial [Bacteroidales bacterium]|nr:YifB family Mg chelatase-like AAA ATPase [Bacteroidales bacterium]